MGKAPRRGAAGYLRGSGGGCDWTRHERRAALARAVRERREYVLPARFDDTSLPGLPPDMVMVDLRTKNPHQFAVMIASKLAALGIITL